MIEEERSFTFMTYNVHKLVGNDREYSPARVAEVINSYRPDIVAVQELPGTRFRPETGGCCQDLQHELALLDWGRELIHSERERWGSVVLSRFPMRLVRAGGLQPPHRRRTIVPRGVIWVEVEIHDHFLQVVNTHLGLTPPERASQVNVLAGPEWLLHPACRPPIVLAGDFNSLPSSAVHKRLKDVLNDEQQTLTVGHSEWTFPSHYPIVKFDHLFVSPMLRVENVEIPQTNLTRVASDHLPLVVRLRFV